MRLQRLVSGLVAVALAQVAVHAQDYDVVPLQQCNTASAEYAPTYDVLTSSLVFTTDASGVAALVRAQLHESTGLETVGGTFNSPRHQRGCVSLDTMGSGVGVMYVSHSDQAYASLTTITRFGNDINLGSPIGGLNGAFYTSQPALSPDGSRLVFVSNRDGGRGRMDLWLSERRDDGSWSEPINLGRNVNSDGDDLSPSLSSSDTLLFASNGFGGKGGFDIMMSVFRDGVWHEPVPIDGVNSEYDDSDPVILPDGSMVFASSRPGGSGGLDLWQARRK